MTQLMNTFVNMQDPDLYMRFILTQNGLILVDGLILTMIDHDHGVLWHLGLIMNL